MLWENTPILVQNKPPTTVHKHIHKHCSYIERAQKKRKVRIVACGEVDLLYGGRKHAHICSFMHEKTQHTLWQAMTPADRLKSTKEIIQLWWSRKNNCTRINALCLDLIREISESGRRNAFKSCKPLVWTEVIHWTTAVFSCCRVLGLMIISRGSITDCHWVLMSCGWCMFTELFKDFWCKKKKGRQKATKHCMVRLDVNGQGWKNTTSNETICVENQTESPTEEYLLMYDTSLGFQSENTIYFILNY